MAARKVGHFMQHLTDSNIRSDHPSSLIQPSPGPLNKTIQTIRNDDGCNSLLISVYSPTPPPLLFYIKWSLCSLNTLYYTEYTSTEHNKALDYKYKNRIENVFDDGKSSFIPSSLHLLTF